MKDKCLLRKKEKLLLAAGFTKFDGTNKPANDTRHCWCILNKEVQKMDEDVIAGRLRGYNSMRASRWVWHAGLPYSIAYFKLV